jgi:hypothetical protein
MRASLLTRSACAHTTSVIRIYPCGSNLRQWLNAAEGNIVEENSMDVLNNLKQKVIDGDALQRKHSSRHWQRGCLPQRF